MVNNQIIVIGISHYNPLNIVRALGENGYYSNVIILSSRSDSFVCHSRYVRRTWVVKCEEEILEILFGEFTDEELKPVLYTTSDKIASCLDSVYDRLKDKFILFNCASSVRGINYYMDKNVMNRVAESVGFNTPKSLVFDLSQDFTNEEINYLLSKNKINLPCIVKPESSSGGSKTDFKICTDKYVLWKILQNLSGRVSKVLIQEYLEPDYEFSFPAVSLSRCGDIVIPGVVHKQHYCKNVYNMGMLIKAYLNVDVASYIDCLKVKQLIKMINYAGLFSLDFIVSKGKVYFLEMNFRTDGNTFLATKAGINLPLLWLLDVTNNADESSNIAPASKICGVNGISLIKNLNMTNFVSYIKDFFEADCYTIWDRTDPQPFLFKFITH